ncbi:NAD(+)/NADH kinase [Nonomuraea sp. NPDC046570]|uniref:ATP-NAD kinase family protein n=1 Tax=Nonomuraea sp. NPDC046570 TaxID=3155255 RepID=UPI00340C92A4
MSPFTVGLVVNPVAGLGGAVGLKGSDGAEVQREALSRGATPQAANRAAHAVRTLLSRHPATRIVTVPGAMGEHSAQASGAVFDLVGLPASPVTTPADTRAAVIALKDVDLLLFAGGDGTARDVLDAVRGLGVGAPPVLGVPAGVKVYSGCFALSPAAAGFAAADYAASPRRAEAEVVDLDEERYRHGRVSPRLYGVLAVPADRARLSGRKTGSSSAAPATVEGIAGEVVARMRPGVRYVLGPGATTTAVGRELDLVTTLLGVDVVEYQEGRSRLVASDVTEAELFALVNGHEAVAVLSVIGGQGFVLGRGNQQLSPRVLRAVQNLVVLATQQKLAALNGRPLLADTGEEDLDHKLAGHVQVITGYRESTVYRIAAASEENL